MAQVQSLFRNQLVLENQRILFDYWQSKFREDALPRRCDICPTEFSKFLPLTSLLDVRGQGASRSYSFRLAGTGLHTHFKQDVTGKQLTEVFCAKTSSFWQRTLDGLVDRKKPSCGAIRPEANRDYFTQFWMRLPLVDAKGEVSMILSYDVFTLLSNLSDSRLNRVAIV